MIVTSRLSVSQSLLHNLICTARRRGVSFAPAKETKTGQRGTELSPLQTLLTLGCAGYEYCFSATAEKQIRTARRYAPKVACGGIFIARALEREGRTTTPLPSSEEGNYGGSEQTLLHLQYNLCRQAIMEHGRTPPPKRLHYCTIPCGGMQRAKRAAACRPRMARTKRPRRRQGRNRCYMREGSPHVKPLAVTPSMTSARISALVLLTACSR